MRYGKIASVITGVAVFLTGCGTAAPILGPPAPSSSGPSSSGPSSSSPIPLAPGGLLVAVHTYQHADHDQLVFEFGGTEAPTHRIKYVDQLHADPSDKVIPLLGTAFLQVVLDGGTLDTSPRESDPGIAQRYDGPTRFTPDLPLIKEVTVAGDFEGVLIFGVGLARPAEFHAEALTSPARVAIDIWYAPVPGN